MLFTKTRVRGGIFIFFTLRAARASVASYVLCEFLFLTNASRKRVYLFASANEREKGRESQLVN